MYQEKSFFFEGENGVLRRHHSSMLDLDQALVCETLLHRLFCIAHHSKMAGR